MVWKIFGKSITSLRNKKAHPGFDKKWLDFVDGSKERGRYEYWLVQDKEEVVREVMLHSLKHKSREKEILHKTAEYNLDKEDLESVVEILSDPSIPMTEREALVKSRIGQGRFRENLKKFWSGKCAVTGLSMTQILKASHIKPWRDSDNYERLDGFNGLLLTPNLDSLFDRFLISFDHGGRIMISQSVDSKSLNLLGVDGEMRLLKVDKEHQSYLEYHRKKFNSMPV